MLLESHSPKIFFQSFFALIYLVRWDAIDTVKRRILFVKIIDLIRRSYLVEMINLFTLELIIHIGNC